MHIMHIAVQTFSNHAHSSLKSRQFLHKQEPEEADKSVFAVAMK